MSFSREVKAELLNNNESLDDKRIFVKESYIQGGVISNPSRTYHLQFSVSDKNAEKLVKILNKFNLNPKTTARGGQNIVYIKGAEEIADVLNIMGAHKSLLTFEGMRVEKHIRNSVNRKVNFETANLNKTVNAAQTQIDAIKYISKKSGLSVLTPPLEEVARLRLEHEEATLNEIGQMLNPPIGKSGVNHRLRKICTIAFSMENT